MIAWFRKKREAKEKPRFSKGVVLIVILLNYWFANKTFNAFVEVGSEPVTLITAWFSFTVGELFLLSRIKIKGDEMEKGGEDVEC